MEYCQIQGADYSGCLIEGGMTDKHLITGLIPKTIEKCEQVPPKLKGNQPKHVACS